MTLFSLPVEQVIVYLTMIVVVMSWLLRQLPSPTSPSHRAFPPRNTSASYYPSSPSSTVTARLTPPFLRRQGDPQRLLRPQRVIRGPLVIADEGRGRPSRNLK